MNSTLILTFGTTCLVSIFVSWAARSLAGRLGLVDRPDGHRKLHLHPVPRLGGVAVFIAFAVGCAALVALKSAGLSPTELSRRASLFRVLGSYPRAIL